MSGDVTVAEFHHTMEMFLESDRFLETSPSLLLCASERMEQLDPAWVQSEIMWGLMKRMGVSGSRRRILRH